MLPIRHELVGSNPKYIAIRTQLSSLVVISIGQKARNNAGCGFSKLSSFLCGSLTSERDSCRPCHPLSITLPPGETKGRHLHRQTPQSRMDH